MAAIRKLWSTKHRFRVLMIIFGVGLIYALPFVPAMAGIWLQIDGIEGESTDAAHPKWIEVESFDWSASMPMSGGATSGSATKTDIKLKKSLDKSSPQLFHSLVTGQMKSTATVEFTRNTGIGEVVYYKLNLSDVFVTGLAQNVEGLSNSTEEVSLNFGTMEMIYYPVDPKTGKQGSPVSAYHNFTPTKY